MKRTIIIYTIIMSSLAIAVLSSCSTTKPSASRYNGKYKGQCIYAHYQK